MLEDRQKKWAEPDFAVSVLAAVRVRAAVPEGNSASREFPSRPRHMVSNTLSVVHQSFAVPRNNIVHTGTVERMASSKSPLTFTAHAIFLRRQFHAYFQQRSELYLLLSRHNPAVGDGERMRTSAGIPGVGSGGKDGRKVPNAAADVLQQQALRYGVRPLLAHHLSMLPSRLFLFACA